jgi:secreted PhoX family phosphatase
MILPDLNNRERKNMSRKSLMGALALTTALAAPSLLAAAEMHRIATVPYKAEVTGILVNEAGELFFNAQHPDGAGEAKDGGPAALIGYVAGTDFNNYSGPGVPIPPEDARGAVHADGEYVVLGRSGDPIGDGTVIGGVYTRAGELMFVSNDVDYNAFVRLSDDEAYLYTAFEGASRKGVSSIVRLKLEKKDGRWATNAGASKSIDLSSIEGAWVLCFGSTTPWGSELFAEEYYFFNTALWNHPLNHDENENYFGDNKNDVSYHMPKMMDKHLGRTSNPYRYGYMIEMGDVDQPDVKLTRHYAMGRFSHENGVVMGDERTVYMSDDDSPKYTETKYNSNSGGVFFKFIADHAGDLSSGTLYAAKATQDAGTDPQTTGFAIEWVELAHGDNATIDRWISQYEGITPAMYVEGQTNYISDADVWNWAEGKTGQDLNGDGAVGRYPDDRPAFLESRKAAAALGATYEWNKMEGITADGAHVYLAMSEVGISMDAKWGHAPWNTGARDKAVPGVIALDEEACGGVYRGAIEANYNISRLDPAVMGRSGEGGCDPEGIANPDNIAAFSGGLLIAEDAGPKMHPVDMLWLVKN